MVKHPHTRKQTVSYRWEPTHNTTPIPATPRSTCAPTPADELYNAAEDRLSAVIDLLGILSLSTLDAQPLRNVLQLNRALLLLASDAHSLYQADREQRDAQR
ncbi:hypothetical protein [Pseudomonas nicosulfuronedens]